MNYTDVISGTIVAKDVEPVGNFRSTGFEEFASGKTVRPSDIEKILSAAGCRAVTLDNVRYGYFRKVTTQFTTTSTSKGFAKIALHPYSVSLLEQEARGVDKFRTEGNAGPCVPTYDLRRLTNDTAVALMETLPGTTARPAHILKRPPTPFGQSFEWVSLPPFIEDLLKEIPDDDLGHGLRQLVERIPHQLSIEAIPVSPAHGDFVYWNILKSPNGSFSVLDFEDYKPVAVAGYDLFYWHVLPMTRFTLRHSLQPLQVALINIAAKTIWNYYGRQIAANHAVKPGLQHQLARCALAIMLATHAAQMLSEHQLADIIDLIGSDALTLRRRLCHQYSLLLEAILR